MPSFPSLPLLVSFLMLFIFLNPQCFKSIKRCILYILSRLKILEGLEENILSDFNSVLQGQFCFYDFKNIRVDPPL